MEKISSEKPPLAPKWMRSYRTPHPDAVVLTRSQFCVRYHISPQKLALMWSAGLGPKRTMNGTRVLILISDAEAWNSGRDPGHGYAD